MVLFTQKGSEIDLLEATQKGVELEIEGVCEKNLNFGVPKMKHATNGHGYEGYRLWVWKRGRKRSKKREKTVAVINEREFGPFQLMEWSEGMR